MRKIMVEVPIVFILIWIRAGVKLFYRNIYPDDENTIYEPCYECKQAEVKDNGQN